MTNEKDLLTAAAAAQYLHARLTCESVMHWRQVLTNNRRPDRTPSHRIKVITVRKRAFYEEDELQKYIRFEKSRRMGGMRLTGRAAEMMRAFGIGGPNGGTTGRALKISALTPQIDEGTGEGFVQLVIEDPLTVFRLDATQATEVGLLLEKAVAELNLQLLASASAAHEERKLG